MKKNIVHFFDTIVPLFLNDENKEECFVIVAKEAHFLDAAKANFKEKNIIPINLYDDRGECLSEKEILYSKELLRLLIQKNITHMITPHKCTKEMKDWAKKYKITLIGTPYEQQQEYENKIFFDNLLKKYNLRSPQTFNVPNLEHTTTGYVVQNADSYGLFGTKRINSTNAVLKEAKKSKTKLLIRKYLEGISIGVGIFIDKNGNHFFTSFRRQCFNYKKNFPDTFLGIQWFPTNYFNKQLTKNIYMLLEELSQILIAKKFLGVANIDILIHDNTPYILECNPRVSSATAQLFSVPSLSGYPQAYEFFVKTFIDENQTVKTKIPFTTYEGCLLDIDIKNSLHVKKIPQIGVYEVRKNKLKFIDSNVTYLNKPNRIFMIHYIQKEGIYSNTELCTIIANEALFNFQSGTLNSKGKNIYKLFSQKFQK